jgi:hypothetical protein
MMANFLDCDSCDQFSVTGARPKGLTDESLSMSLVAFACIFAGAFVGMFLRKRLPGHHLSGDTKDVVRLGTGLIGTIAALVLGLIIASANSAYETQAVKSSS